MLANDATSDFFIKKLLTRIGRFLILKILKNQNLHFLKIQRTHNTSIHIGYRPMILFPSAKISPKFDLKFLNLTYTMHTFSWKKMTEICQIFRKRIF
jgi:hypothetical protein